MNAKQFIMLFAVGLLLCPLSMPAHAQAGGNCSALWYCGWYSFSSGCIPAPPQGAFNCQSTGPWSEVCSYLTTNCPPPPPPCCIHCCPTVAGGPISLVDGNTYIEESDIKIPGLSNGLSLTRNWISKWPSMLASSQVGLFGLNWRSTYEERVFVGSNHYVEYTQSDGSFWSFVYAGTAYVPVSPANATATLTLDSGNTHWTLTLQNGEQRIFSYLSGSLTSIIDRNGNTTQLTYDAINRLTTVTDPAARHIYFSYPNNTSYLVSGVSSDAGISLSYAYDTNKRLTQVTNPDLATLSFAFDSNSFISSVTDSNGKVLESHTYDSSGRGLTSSRANGVESVTVSYPSQ